MEMMKCWCMLMLFPDKRYKIPRSGKLLTDSELSPQYVVMYKSTQEHFFFSWYLFVPESIPKVLLIIMPESLTQEKTYFNCSYLYWDTRTALVTLNTCRRVFLDCHSELISVVLWRSLPSQAHLPRATTVCSIPQAANYSSIISTILQWLKNHAKTRERKTLLIKRFEKWMKELSS